jgi:hypothetical protein
MPIVTQKKNAQTHPGCVVLELQKKCCTTQQVVEDKMLEKAEAAAAAENAAATHYANVRHVAELKDIVERDSRVKQRHSARPDLRPSHGQTAQKFMSEVTYAAQLNELEPIDEQYEYVTWLTLNVADFTDIGNSISSSLDSRQNASFVVYGDKISTVSPASFTDAEKSIIEVWSSEDKNTTASQGKDNREDIDDGNKNKDKVCSPCVPLVYF